MKNFNVTSMLVMLMFMCITSMQAQSITPSKKYITKELNNVSNFSSIRVLGSPDVEYRQSSDSKTTVSIYGSDNLVDLLEVSTVNGVLQVNIKKGVKILSGERRLKVIASSPSLDDVDIKGSADVYLKGTLKGADLNLNMFGLTFDFFVDWAINQISPYVWIKRILLPNYTYDEFIGKLDFEMEKEFGKDYLCRLGRFATEYDMQIQFIVFHDDLDWSNDRNELLIVSLFFKEGHYSFSPQKYSLSEFKELIKSHSGGPVSIGSKGLIYGTSRLECSLSKTDSLYPGDADLLLLNEDNKAVCILEFKKHTLSSPISEQCFTNYYPRPDGRKYKRLALLRDYLASKSNSRILFFVLYYPTQTYIEQQWKLEVIEGNAFSLRATDSFIFELPADKSDNEYKKVIEKISQVIAARS